MHEGFRKIKEKLAERPNLYGFMLFLLWALSLLFFPLALISKFLGLFYFLFLNSLAALVLYIGFLRSGEGKRSLLIIFFGVVAAVFTLVMDLPILFL